MKASNCNRVDRWPIATTCVKNMFLWEPRTGTKLLWNLLEKNSHFLIYKIYKTPRFWRVTGGKPNICVGIFNQKGLPAFNFSFLLFIPEWIQRAMDILIYKVRIEFRGHFTPECRKFVGLRPWILRPRKWIIHD